MTAKKKNSDNEQLVRDYLAHNPYFFEQNPDIFEAINISHDSGKAISLVERQVNLIRERNKELSTQIEYILSAAKENEVLMEKTKRLVLNLVQATDLNTLIKALNVSLKSDFSTEFFSLTLIDNGLISSNTSANIVSKTDAEENIGAIITAKKAVCGIRNPKEIALLFDTQADSIGSVIALPLKNNVTFGILALGHSDSDFYSNNIGTVFIDYIGDLLNQLIPKHLELNS
jgi:uncharacterized protein YigA (DUF484 family)